MTWVKLAFKLLGLQFCAHFGLYVQYLVIPCYDECFVPFLSIILGQFGLGDREL